MLAYVLPVLPQPLLVRGSLISWFLEELFFALLLHCAVTIILEIAFFRNCVGCFAPGCDWAISDLWQQVTRKQGNGLSTFYFPFPPIILAQNKQQTMKQAKLSNFPCLHLFHLMRMVSGHKLDIATDIDTGLSVADGKQESWLWSGFFYLTEQHYSM